MVSVWRSNSGDFPCLIYEGPVDEFYPDKRAEYWIKCARSRGLRVAFKPRPAVFKRATIDVVPHGGTDISLSYLFKFVAIAAHSGRSGGLQGWGRRQAETGLVCSDLAVPWPADKQAG